MKSHNVKYKVRPHRQPTSVVSDSCRNSGAWCRPCIPVHAEEMCTGLRAAQAPAGGKEGKTLKSKVSCGLQLYSEISPSESRWYQVFRINAVMRVRYISKKSKTKGKQINTHPPSGCEMPPEEFLFSSSPSLLRSTQGGEGLQSLILDLRNISSYTVKICPVYCFQQIWNSLDYGREWLRKSFKMSLKCKWWLSFTGKNCVYIKTRKKFCGWLLLKS